MKKSDYLTVDIKKLDVKVKPIVKGNDVKFEVNLKFDTILNGFKGKLAPNQVRKKSRKSRQGRNSNYL